ncbi:hypothetical protein K439DRAFT_1646602 [Ramaria rubella]|nr:hypothetical protein K439DRAFT_1646602 [Ramaria rubella]
MANITSTDALFLGVIPLLTSVIWIAIHVCSITDILHYMDDSWSYDMGEELVYYAPYDSSYPQKQVMLLCLWDDLSLPHSKDKQVYGRTLEIIGLLVDPSLMMITMVSKRKDELVAAICGFRMLGWINWALNVFPLLKPGLQSAYSKISGKSHSRTPIFLNHADADGVDMLNATVWYPGDADLHIFCDATLTHLAFYCLARNAAFCSTTSADTPCSSIFFFEALAVVSALTWASQLDPPPRRLIIHSDSLNTMEMFHSLRTLDGYNDLLLYSVRILLLSKISPQVAHISGDESIIADALLRMLLDVALSLHLNLAIRFFQPPWDAMGAVEL